MTRFVEFMGASGGEVFINAENIALISVGSPELSNSGLYFDPIRVYVKKGHEVERWIEGGEEPYALFMVEYDYLPYWVEHWRDTLEIPEFSKKAE